MANTYNMSDTHCVPSLSCDDSSLSQSANIIGIITFVYAWAVGLGLLTKFRNSTGDARSFSESLTSSMRELQLLEPFIKTLETKAHDPQARAFLSELSLSTAEAVDRLNEFENSLGMRQWLRGDGHVGNGRLRSRTNFIMKQKDLTKMITDKDRAMERMRCAMVRYEQYQTYKHREQQLECFGQQDTMLRQQQQLLENITQRLEALGATHHVSSDPLTTRTETMIRNSSASGDT